MWYKQWLKTWYYSIFLNVKILRCCANRSERHRFQVGVPSHRHAGNSFQWFSHSIWCEFWSAWLHHATLGWHWPARLRWVCSSILLLHMSFVEFDFIYLFLITGSIFILFLFSIRCIISSWIFWMHINCIITDSTNTSLNHT